MTASLSPKTLVFLFGPPAVGKMTVGRALSALTGWPLYHNHLSIEAVQPVFDFGTKPFNRLVTAARRAMFEEVVESELDGLIFTFVWSFGSDHELAYVDALTSIFTSRGGRVVFAELWADLETRLERNQGASRLAEKRTKRDVAWSRKHLLEAESQHRFRSDGDVPSDEHFFLDNGTLTPEEAAERIARHFGLPLTSEA